MRLRVKPYRFKTKSGKMHTDWMIEEYNLLCCGWYVVVHHGSLLSFRYKADADEFVRKYNALKK